MKRTVLKTIPFAALAATTVFALMCTGAITPSSTSSANESQNQPFDITQEVSENVTVTQFNNILSLSSQNNKARSAQSDLLAEFAEEHPAFDLELARTSNNVIYQEESVTPLANLPPPKPNPNFPNPDNPHLRPDPPNPDGLYDSDSWYKDDYLIITTSLYQRGYDDGDPVFYVKGHVQMHKNFFYNHTDHLVIKHSDGAVFKPLSTNLDGKLIVEEYHLYNKTSKMVEKSCEYASGVGGIDYNFKWPSNTNTASYTNVSVSGGYYIKLKSDAVVAVTYIHDKSFLGGNISIGLSYFVGITIDIPPTFENYTALPVEIKKY